MQVSVENEQWLNGKIYILSLKLNKKAISRKLWRQRKGTRKSSELKRNGNVWKFLCELSQEGINKKQINIYPGYFHSRDS
jgi:hypothetical protein